MNKALFLDRDGVINVDSPDYIKSVGEWCPLPGSLEAIARLTDAGYGIVVLTNQSGVARGLYDETMLARIHARMERDVENLGGRLAGIYHCPHMPTAGCACRKPNTGMIERACAELDFDAAGAPMVGDRISDLQAARSAGCRPILVRSGLEIPSEIHEPRWRDVEIFHDLGEVAEALLAEPNDEGEGLSPKLRTKAERGGVSDISLQRQHDLPAAQVRAQIEGLATKLNERLGGTWSWQGDTVVCELAGATARVEYDERLISVDVTLPWAFKRLRSRLESKIEESFDRYF